MVVRRAFSDRSLGGAEHALVRVRHSCVVEYRPRLKQRIQHDLLLAPAQRRSRMKRGRTSSLGVIKYFHQLDLENTAFREQERRVARRLRRTALTKYWNQ